MRNYKCPKSNTFIIKENPLMTKMRLIQTDTLYPGRLRVWRDIQIITILMDAIFYDGTCSSGKDCVSAASKKN